jgi:hypothetical protein
MTPESSRLSNLADVQDSQVREALDGMRNMLAADGYDLEVNVKGNRLNLNIIATPSACEDCLVPKELLGSIAADMLRKSMIEVHPGEIGLTYPTDSGPAF